MTNAKQVISAARAAAWAFTEPSERRSASLNAAMTALMAALDEYEVTACADGLAIARRRYSRKRTPQRPQT